MNLQDYISSGILEAYVLGEVTFEERQELERQLSNHPELKEELRKTEVTLEAFAQKAAIAPRPEVKAKVLEAAKQEKKETKVVQLPFWRFAAAASIALALLTSYLAYSYRSRWVESQTALDNLIAQNKQMAEDYNVVNQKLDKIQGDLSIIENTAFRKVLMKGTANDLTAQASVYWNESTSEAYLSIKNLKEISRENQFQLWAIVDGKPVDAGVFDNDFSGLLKMKNIAGAAAFAVTVEPRGGKPNPTLETMQVLGMVDRKKS